jgi:hypothetical protein
MDCVFRSTRISIFCLKVSWTLAYLASRAFARYHGVARGCISSQNNENCSPATDVFDRCVFVYFALEVFKYACLHHGNLVAGHGGFEETILDMGAKGNVSFVWG